MVASFQDNPQRSLPLVFMLLCPLSHRISIRIGLCDQGVYSGKDGVHILRLGHKRHCQISLGTFSGESQLPYHEDAQATLWSGEPHDEELRFSAKSQCQVVGHMKKLSSKWTLQLSVKFQIAELTCYCNLMRDLEPEHIAKPLLKL